MAKIEAISVAFVRRNRSEVLLLQRAKNRGYSAGKWDVLGGEMQPAETYQETVIRDAAEKLQIREVTVLDATQIESTEGIVPMTRHIFVCTGNYSHIVPDPSKYDMYHWYRKQKIEEIPLTLGAEAVLKKIGLKS